MDNQENRSRFEVIPPEEYRFDPHTGEPINPANNPYVKEEVDKRGMTAKDRKLALTWCILSLVLETVPGIIMYIINMLSDGRTVSNDSVLYTQVTEHLMAVGEFVVVGAAIAGLVLMILTRVKYPKYIFGLVLMIIYIVEFVLLIISVILIIIACNVICGACAGGSAARMW